MKNFARNVIGAFLLICLINFYSNAQNKTVTIEKGIKKFTASSTATTFAWYLNSSIQTDSTSNSFSNNWNSGTYWLAVAATVNSCSGDTFSMKVIVKNDITVGGVQVVWATISPIAACPVTNTNPDSIVNAAVNLTGYTLGSSETYTVIYSVDGTDMAPVTGLNTINGAVIPINIVGLTSGSHIIKVSKLIYGIALDQVVDYSTSANAPAITINITTVPVIIDIQF